LDDISKTLNPENVLGSADITVPATTLSKEVADEKAAIIKSIQEAIKELKPTPKEE